MCSNFDGAESADSVLDARDGIKEFELGQDIGSDAMLLRQAIKSHDRRRADGFSD